MITTLELKHIAPYLPYGLNVTFEGDDYIHEVVGISIASKGVELISQFGDYGRADIKDCIPILRPLSDLDKNITHKGKTFNPIKELIKMPLTKENNALMAFYGLNTIGVGKYLEDVADYGSINPKYLSYPLATKLMEWHFDIHHLIEAGLAIDINDLKEELR